MTPRERLKRKLTCYGGRYPKHRVNIWTEKFVDEFTDTFDDLINIRIEAFENIRRGMSREYQSFVIDTANERLNQIRINETPLRPAKYP